MTFIHWRIKCQASILFLLRITDYLWPQANGQWSPSCFSPKRTYGDLGRTDRKMSLCVGCGYPTDDVSRTTDRKTCKSFIGRETISLLGNGISILQWESSSEITQKLTNRGRIQMQTWTRKSWFFCLVSGPLTAPVRSFCFAHRSSDSRFDFLAEITVKRLEQTADWAACSTGSGNSCLKWETRAAWVSWTWRPISHISKCIRRSWCVLLRAACSKVRRGQGDLHAASRGSLLNIVGLGFSPAPSFGWHLCYLFI